LIENTLFNDNGVLAANHSSCPGGGGGGCTCSSTEHMALLQASRNVLDTANGAIAAIGGHTFPPTALVPAGGSLAATHPAADCTQIDSSFVNAPYMGAFQPGGADWTAGWTDYSIN
jgi:hypothetical protein